MSRRIAVLLGVLCALSLLLPRRAGAQEAVEYYATDALGSVRVVFASNGTVKGRMDFGPYGEQLATAEGIGQKVFAQITFDGESAMDYAEARMFQLRTGRFNAPDPVYAGLEEPQRWNRYAYARNNPLLFIDPSGLQESTGPDPSKCTQTIRELNPNDYHCQATKSDSVGGGTSGSFFTWALDLVLGTEPLWSAESSWTTETPSGAYAPSTGVQVAVTAAAVLLPLASKAITAKAATGVAKAASEGTTTLYRAVMDKELADITATQAFRNPYGIESKYFSLTLEKAVGYGKAAYGKYGDTSPYTIVSTEAPTSLVRQWGVTSVDRGIPAVVVPTSGLSRLAPPNVMTYSPSLR